MRWRPALSTQAARQRFNAGCWALVSLATGCGVLVARATLGPSVSVAVLFAVIIHGVVLALLICAWGTGRIVRDPRGNRIACFGGIRYPLSRVSTSLSWSLLYVPMLLAWSVLIRPGSTALYVIPSLSVGLVFGCIVASFIDERQTRSEEGGPRA